MWGRRLGSSTDQGRRVGRGGVDQNWTKVSLSAQEGAERECGRTFLLRTEGGNRAEGRAAGGSAAIRSIIFQEQLTVSW